MTGPSLSLVAGAVAWAVLILAGAPLVAGMVFVDRDLYVWVFLVCLCAFFWGYGGIASAFIERRATPGRLVFLLSVTALAAALLIAAVPGRLSLRGAPQVLFVVIPALPGVCPRFLQIQRLSRLRLANSPTTSTKSTVSTVTSTISKPAVRAPPQNQSKT